MKILIALAACIALSNEPAWAKPSHEPKPFDYARYGGEKYCLKSDFDGNGISDYVAPMGEGWIHVFMNHGTPTEERIDIDAGGVAELYGPRNKTGEHGEPSVKNPSILVRWVGQNHIVFAWTGTGFEKITFPAKP